MLDRDLARLYGVEARALNQAVQRNIERFPDDFMFQLSKEEFENLKSQIAISNSDSSRSQFVTLNEQIDIKGYYFPIAILIFRVHYRARNLYSR